MQPSGRDAGEIYRRPSNQALPHEKKHKNENDAHGNTKINLLQQLRSDTPAVTQKYLPSHHAKIRSDDDHN